MLKIPVRIFKTDENQKCGQKDKNCEKKRHRHKPKIQTGPPKYYQQHDQRYIVLPSKKQQLHGLQQCRKPFPQLITYAIFTFVFYNFDFHQFII